MKLLPGVERFVRDYRPYFLPECHRLYRRIRAQRSVTTGRRDATGERYAFIDAAGLDVDGPHGRRIYLLYTFFDRAGYRVLFRDDLRLLGTMRGPLYKRLLLDHDFGVVRGTGEIPGPFVWISRGQEPELPRHCLRHVRLLLDRPYVKAPDRVPLPFTMNPMIYERGDDRRLEPLRRTPKSWRLFFGGNVDPGLYDRKSLSRRFGKLTRKQMLGTVTSRTAVDQVTRIDDDATFERLISGYFPGLVLATGSHRLPAGRWLEAVARSEFFLACPGSRWPMAHNIVEALATGAIPVTEYPEQFHPALTDGENCVAFSGAEDLAARLKDVFEMGPTDVERLRVGAVEYYERRLSIPAFFSRLDAIEGRRIELHATHHMFPPS